MYVLSHNLEISGINLKKMDIKHGKLIGHQKRKDLLIFMLKSQVRKITVHLLNIKFSDLAI